MNTKEDLDPSSANSSDHSCQVRRGLMRSAGLGRDVKMAMFNIQVLQTGQTSQAGTEKRYSNQIEANTDFRC